LNSGLNKSTGVPCFVGDFFKIKTPTTNAQMKTNIGVTLSHPLFIVNGVLYAFYSEKASPLPESLRVFPWQTCGKTHFPVEIGTIPGKMQKED
jgi:hypothetical protein